MLKRYKQFCNLIEKITVLIIAAFLIEMLAVAWSHVFCRYVLGSSLFWSEELLRFSLVWFALLSASLIFRRKGHLGIVLFVNKLPDRLKELISKFLILVFFSVNLVVTVQGFILTSRVYGQLTPALRIPVSFPYAAVPISFLFMLLYGISDIWSLFNGAAGDDLEKQVCEDNCEN